MHDYHAVETLVGRLRGARLPRLDEVRIQAGPAYSSVALQQAYEMLTLGTALYGSRLVVEPVESDRTCPACGASWQVECGDVIGHLVVCRACGATAQIEGLAELVVVGISP